MANNPKYARRHYCDIAELLKFAEISPQDRDKLIQDFVRLFSGDNARFDSDRFERACLGLK